MFSESQKKIISSALTCLAIVVILLFIIGSFKLFGDFVSYFSSVIYPLVLSGVFFIMLKPIIDFLNDNLKIPRTLSIIIIYLLLCIIFTLLFIFIAPKLANQLESFIKELPILLKSIIGHFLERFPDAKEYLNQQVSEIPTTDILPKLRKLLSKSFSALFSATGSIVAFCSILAAFAVVPIYLFYMLESKRDISKDFDENTKWISPRYREDIKFLITQFIGILSAFFRGQMLIALVMGLLFGLGFSLCGVKFGFVIGLSMGLLNIVPYLGSIIGFVTVLSVAFFQKDGGLSLVALSLVVIAIVQLIESYLLTPKIMKKQTGLHPGVIIFSIFFWGVALKGIIGMILAIPLSAFIVVFWRLLKRNYLKNSQ